MKHGARLHRLDGRGHFVYVRHETNSWQQFGLGSAGWRPLAEPSLPLPDRAFLRSRAGADLCGPSRLLYASPADRRAWIYAYPQARQRWAAGNALLYRRSLWERNRFAEVAVGEDTRFVWNGAARNLFVHDDHRVVVGVVHARNTSPKGVDGAWWTAVDWSEIEAVVGSGLASPTDERLT